MRIFNKIWGMSLIALVMVLASPNKTLAQDEYVSDQVFYDELSPYGTWVSDPDYGNVWVPDVEEGFQPYATRGYWALTSYGNTWVSDYEWGWAPFHYGRWRFDNYYGWTWIPGYEWAPSWVAWRQGGGYYGWAPLSPGLSIDVSFGGYNIPDNYWVCAPEAYITSPNIYDYYVPYRDRVTIINHTTYINNTYVYNNRRYYSGPRSADIQQATGRQVRVYNINNSNRPSARGIRDNKVNIYRPAVRRSEDARPSRVIDGAAYRRENPGQRIADKTNGTNRGNAERLARAARSENPNSSVVKVNDDRPVNTNINRGGRTHTGNDDNRTAQPSTNRANDNMGNRQREPRVQQRDQQVNQQSQDAGRQQVDQQRRQRSQADQQVQDANRQQADQQRRQRQQSDQQVQDASRQQVDQQRRQRDQADQQRQDIRRQQADQQRQQADQQRQQQVEQQRNQQRQQADQQRQQVDQQRQQQAEQQRQQIDQQRQQQRQQADQQRQQQVEQQRQQADQQRQQADQQRQQQRQQQEQQQRQQVDQQRQQQQRSQPQEQRQPRSSNGSERGVRRVS